AGRIIGIFRVNLNPITRDFVQRRRHVGGRGSRLACSARIQVTDQGETAAAAISTNGERFFGSGLSTYGRGIASETSGGFAASRAASSSALTTTVGIVDAW